MWGEESADIMALNPWNAPGAGGANGWPRGPAPAQVGGPGAPLGRPGPGRGMEPPPIWHHQQAAPIPPQWAAHQVHQQQSWQQPGAMNNIPQQQWQNPLEQKKQMMARGMPGMPVPPQQHPPQQWGSHKVDQGGAPWESAAAAAVAKAAAVAGVSASGGNDWQNPSIPWSAPPQQQQQQPWVSPEWQQQQQSNPSRSADPGVGQWQQQQQQPQPPPQQQPMGGMMPQPQQWGQPPPMTHMPQVEQRGMDMNPGQPGPWVAPQPTEVNNDMMWHDPNPKAKRMQRDTGTALWGDPSMQMQDIKRWKEVEDEMSKPSGSDWNMQPTGWGDLPSEHWRTAGWVDEPASHEADMSQLPHRGGGMADPNFRQQGSDISNLTHQISEKLRNAVQKGFVRVELLNQPMPPEKIAVLNQLLTRVPKLEQATQEIDHLRRSGINTLASKSEYDRLCSEVDNLRLEMAMMQTQISDISRGGSVSSGATASRLQQWRKAAADEKNTMDSLVGGLSLEDKPTEWSTGGSDWIGGGDPVLSDVSKEDKDDSGAPSEGDGPREFVPGKKWEWRDPNKVAEDPNATPGSTGAIFGANNLFGGWGGSLGDQTWNTPSALSQSWVSVQLGPNIGDKTVRVTANRAGTVGNAFVSGMIAYLKFLDTTAEQAVVKMKADLPFANIKLVTDVDLPAAVSAAAAAASAASAAAAANPGTWGESAPK